MGYTINVAPGELDLGRFEILLGAARAAAGDLLSDGQTGCS